MPNESDHPSPDSPGGDHSVCVTPAEEPAIPLDRLSDAAVFDRDAEDYTQEVTAETIKRLQKILARYRKARDDEATLLEEAAKIKANNAKAKKAKAKKKGEVVPDPFNQTL